MAKSKRTPLHSAASRKPVIPSLGLPIGVTLTLLGLTISTMVVFRGWRTWLTCFAVIAVLGFIARVRVQRDHNAFHVDGLWLRTKALFLDTQIWRGVTLRSFPRRYDRRRGIFARS